MTFMVTEVPIITVFVGLKLPKSKFRKIDCLYLKTLYGKTKYAWRKLGTNTLLAGPIFYLDTETILINTMSLSLKRFHVDIIVIL